MTSVSLNRPRHGCPSSPGPCLLSTEPYESLNMFPTQFGSAGTKTFHKKFGMCSYPLFLAEAEPEYTSDFIKMSRPGQRSVVHRFPGLSCRPSCVAGNRKIGFNHLPQSQNNCMKTQAYRKPCISHEGPAGRCETQLPGLLNVYC